MIHLEVAVNDEVEILEARGVMVEEMPDASSTGVLGATFKSLAVSQRNILKQLGLERAELRRSTPLSFACRCSPERAAAIIAALPESERASLPPVVYVTCHMCGRNLPFFTAGSGCLLALRGK